MREPIKIRAALGQTLFLSILLGLIYLQMNHDQESAQNRLGVLFMCLLNQAMGSVMFVVNLFPSEKPLFMREYSNKMYSALGFFISKNLVDFPFQMVWITLYAVILYWMVGFVRQFVNFITFWFILVLVGNIGSSFGFIVGILAADSATAITLVPVTIIPMSIFSGFFLNNHNVPPYFIWVEYLSFIKYAFQGLFLNEFSDITFNCKGHELPDGVSCPIPNGQYLIKQYEMDTLNIWECMVILIGMLAFLKIVGYISLLYKMKKSAANS